MKEKRIRLSNFTPPTFYNPISSLSHKEEQIHLALVEAGITPAYIAEKLKSLLEDPDPRIVCRALLIYIEMEGLYKRFDQPIIPIQVNIENIEERLGLNKLTIEEVKGLAHKKGIRVPDSFENN